MKSDKTNHWLSLGANIGVIIGLVLVAYEINQSGTHLQISASSGGVDNFAQAMDVLVQNEELSRLIYKAENAFHELDEFDKWRVSKYLDGFTSMAQQGYLVFIAMDDVAEASGFKDDWRENMRLPIFRDYWIRSEQRFKPEFRKLINGLISESGNQRQPAPNRSIR